MMKKQLVGATHRLWPVWLAAGACVTFLCAPAYTQADRQEPKVESPPAIRLRSDLVSFTVTVMQPGGTAPTTLTPEDFVVYENGQPQKVAYFSTVDAPVDVVLMVDDSGSMRDQLPMVKRAAERFVARMRPQDRGAVVAFGGRVELLADLTRERSKLTNAIKRIPKGRGTSFYDALYLVAREVLQQAGPRRAVVVLSDGVDSSSYYDFHQASRLLEEGNVTAYFIEVDTKADMIQGLMEEKFALSPAQLEKYRQAFKPEDSPLQYRNPLFFSKRETARIAQRLYQLAGSELRRMASRTGGRVFNLERFTQLSDIYGQIGAELGTFYSLGYYPSNSRHDGTWRSLKVEVRIPGAKAHARSGYWAPSR